MWAGPSRGEGGEREEMSSDLPLSCRACAALSSRAAQAKRDGVCSRPVWHAACTAGLRGGHRPEGSWPAASPVRLRGSARRPGAPDGLPSEAFGTFQTLDLKLPLSALAPKAPLLEPSFLEGSGGGGMKVLELSQRSGGSRAWGAQQGQPVAPDGSGQGGGTAGQQRSFLPTC